MMNGHRSITIGTPRVAFEVENTANWKDELCKLAHIVSDLSVLVGYQIHRTWRNEEILQDYLKKMGDRVFRVPGRQWLFIFGPDCEKQFDPWLALAFDDSRKLVSVDAGPPPRGLDFCGPAADQS